MSNVTLTVNNSKYSGWKKININIGLEQMAGTFELTVSEKWPNSPAVRKIKRDDACTIDIDGHVVITGYVDEVMPSINSESHEVTITGRDKTGDLVDCSAIYKAGQWSNQKLDAIASNLCEPFGIKVLVQTDIGEPFKKVTINNSETVFETLSRLAKQRGVLLTTDGLGNLVITRAGNNRLRAALKEGVNIIAASGTFSNRNRHSVYIAKGQHPGSNDLNLEAANEPVAQVKDTGVTRYRPLIILAEENSTIDSLKKRITWQRNFNYGRGTKGVITVAGWKDGGDVWKFNRLIKVESDSLGINGELLISKANYKLDDNGTLTTLTLTRPEAYDVLDIPDTSETGLFF